MTSLETKVDIQLFFELIIIMKTTTATSHTHIVYAYVDFVVVTRIRDESINWITESLFSESWLNDGWHAEMHFFSIRFGNFQMKVVIFF